MPSEDSSGIILTDNDFILTDRTCLIAITADMSFRTAIAANFRRECRIIEFVWKQRPRIGAVAALPPTASQIPGRCLCFLVTRATEKQNVDPEVFGFVSNKTKRFISGEGIERVLASCVRPKQRTTAFSVVVRADTREVFGYQHRSVST